MGDDTGYVTESAMRSYEMDANPSGQVTRQTDRLAGLLEGVDKEIAALRDRLAPVLLMDTPGMAVAESAVGQPMCGQAERLSLLADQAERMRDALRAITARVDL